MDINKKIESLEEMGYRFEIHQFVKYALNITNPNGDVKRLDFGTALKRNIHFANLVEISEKELFNHFFDLGEEEKCVWENGFGLRVKEYLESVKKSIGYTGQETIDDYSGVFADDDLVKTEYFYTDSYAEIDNFGEIKYYFDHEPSEKEIQTAISLSLAKTNFKIGRWKEEFTCWECGRKVHFLDIKGDFLDKIHCMEDRYCGC